jgi:GT2 family glycosyltransferase
MRVFCRGPFRDDRQPVYWHWRRHRRALVDVRMLGGGMLSVRRDALGSVRFDSRYRGASLGEDIDLSWSLAARGARLAIATDAHVVHDRAPRPPARHEEALLTSWGFVYDKHQPKTLANRLAFLWFVTGVVGAATLATLRARSLAPLRSAAAGVRSLVTDFAGSSFLKPRASGLHHFSEKTLPQREGGAHGPL